MRYGQLSPLQPKHNAINCGPCPALFQGHLRLEQIPTRVDVGFMVKYLQAEENFPIMCRRVARRLWETVYPTQLPPSGTSSKVNGSQSKWAGRVPG